MKDKIIIHNYTDLDDYDAMIYVLKVISKGKISKRNNLEQYCFVTIFNSGITISSGRKNNTYTFIIEKMKGE